MSNIFSLAFFLNALKLAVASFSTAFAGSLATAGTPTLKGLEVAGVAAGVAALATFFQQFGAVKALKAAGVKAVTSSK